MDSERNKDNKESCFDFWPPEKLECFNLNEFGKKSFFRLFMQLCTCYAVFLSVAGHFFLNYLGIVRNQMYLCQISTHGSAEMETEPVKSRTCFNMLDIAVSLLFRYSWDPSVCCRICPRTPGGTENVSESPATPTCLKRISFLFYKTVQTLAECS